MSEVWLVWEFEDGPDDILLESVWDTREAAIDHVERELPNWIGVDPRWRYKGDGDWPVEYEIDCQPIRFGR